MPEDSIGADELVEGKHLIKQRQQIQKLEKLIYQRDLAQVLDRLNAKFQDFNDVVSEKNLKKLEQEEPEIFSSIMATEGQTAKGLYNKGILAYKTLKRFGHESSAKQAKSQSVSKLKAQAQANSKKPVSVNSLGKSSGASSFEASGRRMTEADKKRLYQDMLKSMKGLG